MATNLAEALAEDIISSGLANGGDLPGQLRSLDGDVLVELSQDGSTISLAEDGQWVLDLSTTDEDFNEKFIANLASLLNF